MSDFSLTLVLRFKTSKIAHDMAKVSIKSERITPFGGIFHVRELFSRYVGPVIDKVLGLRCTSCGYQYSEIAGSLSSVYFCGGDCVEDVTSHLMPHLSLHPTLRTCSSDTILRGISELATVNTTYTSDTGKSYDFNTATKLNSLPVKVLKNTGQLVAGKSYDLDFDHQFIETEKYDAKMTYKKFTGYSPGVAVIGDLIVGIENRDGNANVRFHQQDTLERIYSNLESEDIHVKRSRMDCGSCSREIVETVEKHSELFYIRANRCGSLYDCLLALRGWQREEINGIGCELNSIIVEKWEGKAYRLVIQRERRLDGDITTNPESCATFSRNSSNFTIVNTYYKDGFYEIYDNNKGTKVTASQLASGEMAYRLNGNKQGQGVAWYQNVGTDAYPTIVPNEQYIVYMQEDGTFSNVPTAIEGITADNRENTAIYDLTGRRVEKARQGLYIINGKKVLVK